MGFSVPEQPGACTQNVAAPASAASSPKAPVMTAIILAALLIGLPWSSVPAVLDSSTGAALPHLFVPVAKPSSPRIPILRW